MSPWTGARLNGKTYSATRHLALSVFGANLSDAWMVMVSGLTAYFDVSKPEGEASAYSCAGFAAPVEKWTDKFEPAWRELLAEARIPEFHMADVAAHKKKGFSHITTEIYAAMMLRLVDTIKHHTAKSFARVIDGDALRVICDRGEEPLVLAGLSIIKAAEDWRRNRIRRGGHVGVKPRVEVVFDWCEKGKGALIEAAPRGCVPDFKDASVVLPLQAADWLAWELARLNYVHKKHRGHGGFKLVAVRGTIWHAVHHLPRDWKYYHNGDWVDIFMKQEDARRLGAV